MVHSTQQSDIITAAAASPIVTTPGENYSAYEGAFEGPEKLLEIWFSPSPDRIKDHQNLEDDDSDKEAALENGSRRKDNRFGLRVVPKPVWDKMLALVKCTVLNVISNKDVDAYLLSESSMFVYPHKLILKTCGTTTLLLAVSRLLEIAKSYLGYEKVWRVFYSRKAFMFPERQIGPHRSWDDEVKFLDQFFDDGSSYIVGKERQDQWHLYMTKPSDDVLHHINSNHTITTNNNNNTNHDSPLSFENRGVQPRLRGVMQEHEIASGASTPAASDSDSEDPSPFGNSGHSHPDQTVEIHMTGLNPEKMKKFYHDASKTASGISGGKWVDQQTGIDKLYPSATLDSYLFEPCGYSSNGLWEDRYFTFHVTPEPECSYASFESNIPVEKSHGGKAASADDEDNSPIEDLISQVLDIFDPTSFTVTYFTSHHKEHDSHRHMIRSMSTVNGYKRTNRIWYEFEGYDLVYGHYAKNE
ncbi:adenosylmethionine decarboxylase [Mycotypha africana]|uniref:adenosylmethionine decarboxylase n=1 Tax=Mycotypha africana TaxID=64632 RepID=UPI002301E239|nr:adenosylmethionine decarboxylase [Mycotypha africana]KAI8969247.1 adenosylmethionine decarboxylase [Mycotypha africana]